MIADLKPYPEYRAAEGEWLGSIPSHWKVRRLKFLLREIDQRSTSGKEQLLRVSQYTGVTTRTRADGSEGVNTRADSLIGYKCVEPDDLVINIMLAWNGSMGVSRYTGISSPAYCVYRFGSEAIPWYYHNLLRSPGYKARIKASSTGVVDSRLRLYSDDLGRIEALLPPPAEQSVIVRFLDWANGRLERAIRAKRRVIALLSEQKQAIIDRAVTRGLDPDVPLRSSGIPWLGEIPAHWEVRRLSAVAHFRSGKAHEQFVDASGEHICVTARFVSTDGRDQKFCSENFCRALKGDVLMVMSDLPNGRALARAFLVQDDRSYAVNQRVCAITPHSVDSRWLAYWSNRNWHLLRNDDGLNQTHLSNYDFKTMPVLLPPREEQLEIAAWLDQVTRRADVTSDRLDRECQLLSEYRTRLTADVVTGKLDVREAAERLPVEATIDASEDDTDLSDEPDLGEEVAEE
jgi:type I restriction enzyme S subunit